MAIKAIKRKRLAEGSKDTMKDFKKGVTEGSKGVFKGKKIKDMAKGAIRGSKGVFKGVKDMAKGAIKKK
jgi:AMMECR1 domain-containing protein